MTMQPEMKDLVAMNEFKKEGVLLVKNELNAISIHLLLKEINQIRQSVMIKINQMERPLRTYSDIAERQPGRLDYRCGFTSAIFNEMGESIIQLVRRLSPTIDFRHYWGAIPSLSGSGPTDMHRDVYPMLNTLEGNDLDELDISLPTYYITVLIPLVEITLENGPTEFIKGSHRMPVVDSTKAEIYAPLLSPGDIIIFDGRTLHRGSANRSNQERLIAYMTFLANWYHDQTFTINDYLFPEFAIPGH